VTDFPAGFGSDSKWQEDFQITRRWAEDGIIGADVMSTTDADAQFKAGAGGAVVQTINNFGAVEALLKQNNEGAELEIYVNDPAIREKKDGYAKTDFKAWNFLCIPKTAPAAKRDKAMRFMNWLFEDRANHDLFQYGIKGKNWEEAKDAGGAAINNTVSTVGMEAYSFPAYELTWNSDFIRVQAASDPKVQEYTEYMYDVGRYVAIPYAEFTFDPQRTAALATAVNNATLGNGITLAQSYYLGQYANPVAAWNDVLAGRYANASLQAALKTIQEEVIYQLQAYLDR
jgi:putative aldouronate transport system substrate-binding protein